MTVWEETFTDKELLYAASAQCAACGAGLAYPLDPEKAWELRAWVCSAVLKKTATGEAHDFLSFAFWKVREESSINNRSGRTTRPHGTVCRTVGKAKCPKCLHEWESEPYNANGLGHHWFSGPCPECGHSVGSAGTWSSGEGEPIKHTYRTVVLETSP